METLEVPGTDYLVRPITAREMMDLDAENVGGIEGLIRLAHMATVDHAHNQVWKTEDAAGNAPWPVIKACADQALVINQLTGEDLAGN